MSELSKENVIKDTVNQFIEYAEEMLDSYDYERPVDVTINKEDIECIKGLLDLYNKEKEKNKELEKTILEFVNDRERILKTPVISKDKIKEIADDYESKGYIEIAGAMRELLEERN